MIIVKLPGKIVLPENIARAYLTQIEAAYIDTKKKWELEFTKLKPEHKRYLQDMEEKINLLRQQLKIN
jgi:hypothetical protein